MNITEKTLIKILKLHNDWCNNIEGGRQANLSDANLSGANLNGCDLSDANLSGCDLRGADLRGCDLRGANLSDANLRVANLSRANLSGCDLRGCDLRGCDLTDANLRDANLSHTNLRRANMRNADLSGCDLTDVVGGNTRVACLQIHPYRIVIVDKHIVWGGCTRKTAQEWLDYDGANITEDDKKYLETVTKPFIRMVLGK